MEKHGILYRRDKQMEKETLKNKIKRIIPFRRIQRITGYLTTPGRENAGKKAEIKDRVKHQKVEEKSGKKEA